MSRVPRGGGAGRPGGFSLVEVMIAVFIIAIALLGLMSAFAYGIKADELAHRHTEAVNYGRAIMGWIRTQDDWAETANWTDAAFLDGLDDAESDRVALGSAPLTGAGLPANTNMTRNIQIDRDLGASHQANLATVRVRVFFYHRGVEKSVELVALHCKKDPP